MRIYTLTEFEERFLDLNTLAKPTVEAAVEEILTAVRFSGDRALLHYTALYDGVELEPDSMQVTQQEIEAAYAEVSTEWLEALRLAITNIRSFHLNQKEKTWMEADGDGTIRGQLLRPLARVGVYVPGGTAAYPSSVLMSVIPAQVAGVDEIIITTPPSRSGSVQAETLVAAAEVGIQTLYKVGGAQAIGALAYGTESIPRVDKIVGPGNIYVTVAKKHVFGLVDIDMLAGPSEVCIVADSTANPAWVAADLIAQAEHDSMARAVLITTDEQFARLVQTEVQKQLQQLPRREIAQRSLKDYGAIVLVSSLEQGIALANRFAPEHLELAVENPLEYLSSVKNCGAVFAGHYAAESAGDYIAGPNHVLPTGGSSRYFSGLSVHDFVKRIGLLFYTPSSLIRNADHIIRLAESEGLLGHARAISRRMQEQ